MPSPWPLAVILGVGVALLALLAAGPRVFRGSLTVRRPLRCPVRGQPVVVDFEEVAWDGRLADVRQCTAFTPPTAVDCDKECLTAAPARKEGDG